MYKRHLEVYLNLINQLLNASEEDLPKILLANFNLIDAELIQAIGQGATILAKRGEKDDAEFLINLVRELNLLLQDYSAEVLTLPQVENSFEADRIDFLTQVLKIIRIGRGEWQLMSRFLEENLDKLDRYLAESLRIYAASIFSQLELTQSRRIAEDIGNLVTLIAQLPMGDKLDTLEIAIAGYERISDVFTAEAFPKDWIKLQNGLGNVYRHRIQGNPSQNLELAVAAYRKALDVCSPGTSNWAMTQNNLGNAYCNRLEGNKPQNLDLAIACYNEALNSTPQQTPEWAETQNNLGTVCRERGRILQAISAFTQALQVYDRDHEAFSYQWAITQNNLGLAYGDLETVCKRQLSKFCFPRSTVVC